MGKESEDRPSVPPNLLLATGSGGTFELPDALKLGGYLEHIRHLASSDNVDRVHVILLLQQVENILETKNIGAEVSEQIYNHRIELESSNSYHLSPEQKSILGQKVISWTAVINQELKRETRIPATDTGLLNAYELFDSPSSLLKGAVWDWLDERPRSDLREACKCIVVGSSTASVMLSLRAVEHCLRQWYEERNEPMNAAWGAVLDQLMEEYTKDEKQNDTVLTRLSDLPPVLSNLYYLKEKRNEVGHPDRSPDVQEASRTLMVVASTITDIFLELEGEMGKETLSSVEFKFEMDRDTSLTPEEKEAYMLMREMARRKGSKTISEEEIQKSIEEKDLNEDARDLVNSILFSGLIYSPEEGVIKLI